MVYSYIYIISFEGRNEIYIGRTNDIKKRFSRHRYSGSVSDYYISNFNNEWMNNDWSKMYIDIIDSVNMDEDLTYLFKHPENKKNKDGIRPITFRIKKNKDLINDKLKYTELFHILNYKNENKYWLINRYIPISSEYTYHMYKFYNYAKI